MKTITLAHSDLTGTIYAIIGKEKVDITNQAIAEVEAIKALMLKQGHCKDCKWWKDSDGLYRRGVGAESKCPINTKTVYLGDGYCYKFEPKDCEVDK